MRPYLQIIVQKGAYLMKVIIEIPDNFVKHFISDQFQDSLIRVQKDVEAVNMLRKALLDCYIKGTYD